MLHGDLEPRACANARTSGQTPVIREGGFVLPWEMGTARGLREILGPIGNEFIGKPGGEAHD